MPAAVMLHHAHGFYGPAALSERVLWNPRDNLGYEKSRSFLVQNTSSFKLLDSFFAQSPEKPLAYTIITITESLSEWWIHSACIQ